MSGGAGQRAAFRRRQTVLRRVVVTLVLLFFFTPLLASLDFTTRDASGNRTLQTWTTLLNFPAISERYPDLQAGFVASVGLAVLTVGIMLVLLVPTMT
ncbi:MAG: hypothetical protein ACXVW1_14555, partial [Nocardioides sp.]